jgi:hypothetical protein
MMKEMHWNEIDIPNICIRRNVPNIKKNKLITRLRGSKFRRKSDYLLDIFKEFFGG